MREDRVKLFNPLPSHSSPLPLSFPLSSFSLKLGFDLDFWSKDWWSFLEGNLGASLLLLFLSIARQVYDSNLLSFLCDLVFRVLPKFVFFMFGFVFSYRMTPRYLVSMWLGIPWVNFV